MRELQEDQMPSHSWPRFGLRHLLIALTICSFLFAWLVVRYRSANQLIEKRDVTLTTLIEQRLEPPDSLVLAKVDSLGLWAKERPSIDEFFRVDSQNYDSRVWGVFTAGRSVGNTLTGWTYELSSGNAAASASGIRDQIREHFAAGLVKVGFDQRSSMPSDGTDEASSRDCWCTAHNGIVVLLDVEVNKAKAEAKVKLSVVESQHLGIW